MIDAVNRVAGLWWNAWQDTVVLAGLLITAVLLDRDFITTGDYLPLSYGDWIAHAYRARFFQEYGLATWDHNWAGGLSLFQSYQFVPSAVTAGLSSLADASIGRSMLVEEGLLLIWLRVSGYVTARALGLPPAAALAAGVVTFGLNDYALPITSFSSLWSLASLPLLVAAAYRLRDRPAIYLVAVATGLGIYVHPHLAVSGVAVLIAAFVVSPPTARRLGRLAAQLGLVAMASSFYWVPAFFSAKPVFHGETSSSARFLRMMLSGGVDRFSDVLWLLLPLTAAITVVFWQRLRHPMLRYVGAFLGLELFLIAASYVAVGPESVRIMQNVRLLTALPLGLGLWAAIAADAVLRRAAEWGRWRLLGPASTVLVALVFAVPIVRFAADQPFRPTWFGPDPVSDWLTAHENDLPGRIWFDDVETPWYTFKHFGEVRGSQSHFPVGEWSLLKIPLLAGMFSAEDFDKTEEYMKAMAVSYLVVPDARQPIATELRPGGSLAGRLTEVARVFGYSIYSAPWEPVEAFHLDSTELPSLDFPDVMYKEPSEKDLRDRLVLEYNGTAYSDEAEPVRVEYPSATTMTVRLRDLPPRQYLVISENWDSVWHARTADGRTLPVQRFGPNYIGVDLSQIDGDVVVELHHGMSRDWQLGIALTALSLPMAAALVVVERRWATRLDG